MSFCGSRLACLRDSRAASKYAASSSCVCKLVDSVVSYVYDLTLLMQRRKALRMRNVALFIFLNYKIEAGLYSKFPAFSYFIDLKSSYLILS